MQKKNFNYGRNKLKSERVHTNDSSLDARCLGAIRSHTFGTILDWQPTDFFKIFFSRQIFQYDLSVGRTPNHQMISEQY